MIPSSIYNVDLGKLIQRIIPNRLKTAQRLAWLQCLAYPFSYIYQQFLLFRTAKNYQLLITPQVCYMELMLNGRYDNILQRITIKDGLEELPTYIFQEAELKPVFIFQEAEDEPIFIYTDG